jgi:hypothetical protein
VTISDRGEKNGSYGRSDILFEADPRAGPKLDCFMKRERKPKASVRVIEGPPQPSTLSRWAHFREWQTLRWFLALLLPPAFSLVWNACQKGLLGSSLLFFFFAAALAAILFTELCSGIAESNWGRFPRKTDPGMYWFSVFWTFVFYVVFSIAPFLPRAN